MHDAYARFTPMELTFPERDDQDDGFPRILREVQAEYVDPTDPGGLLSRVAARELLSSTIGEEESAEAIQEYASLLYHSFNAWLGGAATLLLSSKDARDLTETTESDSPPELTMGGRYVQLPQHLFWVVDQTGADPPESVDGFFVTRGKSQLSVLVAMGVRPDRPGFSVVDVPAQPIRDLSTWIHDDMREAGRDFSSSLPGAELEGLMELATPGEIMKLAARTLVQMEKRGVVEPSGSVSEGQEGAAMSPRPSELPFVRLAGDA